MIWTPKKLTAKLRNSFFTGILTAVPILATLYLTLFILRLLNKLLSMPLAGLLESNIPGIRVIVPLAGLLISVGIICGIGFLTANIVGKKFITKIEELLAKVPIVNTIYTSIKQLAEILLGKSKGSFTRVVLVEYPRKGIYSVGFVSSEENKRLSKTINNDLVNVYLPTALNIASGFLIVAPVSEIIPLDISVEEGLKLVISGGIITPPVTKEVEGRE